VLASDREGKRNENSAFPALLHFGDTKPLSSSTRSARAGADGLSRRAHGAEKVESRGA
jgi:hypothetical protein